MFCPLTSEIKRNDKSPLFPQKNLDYKSNIMNSGSKEFYLQHGVDSVEPAFEVQFPSGSPLLMKTKYCIKFELGFCPREQNRKEGTDFKEPFYLRDAGRRYKLQFDCKACEMNLYLDNIKEQD